MRIKVTREKLIQAIELRRDNAVIENQRERRQYPTALKAWKTTVIRALEKANGAVRSAMTSHEVVLAVGSRYERTGLFNLDDAPKEPKTETEVTEDFDDILKRLRLSSDEFIVLDDKNDYAKYI